MKKRVKLIVLLIELLIRQARDRYMVKHAGERIRNDIERQRTRDRKCICGPYI